MTVVDRFVFLVRCLTKDDSTVVQVNMHLIKVRTEYTGLKHLWHRHDTTLRFKGYGTSSSPIGNVRWFVAFNHQCMPVFACSGWNDVGNQVLVQRMFFQAESISVDTVGLTPYCVWEAVYYTLPCVLFLPRSGRSYMGVNKCHGNAEG